MTIDEFLTSDRVSYNFQRSYLLKVQYNENIDFIYKPSYRRFRVWC